MALVPSHCRLLGMIGLIALVAACEPKGPTEEEVKTRAQAVLDPFKKSLREALMSELQKSPVSAIDVCSLKAPELAEEASKNGVLVGRASHKLRNPKNAPSKWLEPVIRELSQTKKEDNAFRVVDLGGGRRGYVEPIWVDAPCLVCHGANVGPDIKAKLSERYPNDAATGYEMGDFRGVFWVELAPQ